MAFSSEKYPELFHQQGVWSFKELNLIIKERRKINSLLTRKIIKKVGSGYYASNSLNSFDASILIVAKFFPDAVITGKAALYIYGIIKTKPAIVEVEYPKSKSAKNSLLKFRRISEKKMVGIDRIKYCDSDVPIYKLDRLIFSLIEHKYPTASINKTIARYFENNLDIDLCYLQELDSIFKTNVYQRVLDYNIENGYLKSIPEIKASDLDNNLIGAAIALYGEKGRAGLTLPELSKSVGLPVEKLICLFGSNKGLKSAVSQAHQNWLENELPPFELSNKSPSEQLSVIINTMISMIDKDPIGYRIQLYSLLEDEFFSKRIIEVLASNQIKLFTELFSHLNSKFSQEECLSRAILVASVLDNYALYKWHYVDSLQVGVAKEVMLNTYTKFLKNSLVDILS